MLGGVTAASLVWHPPFTLDLRRTLAPLRRGGGDPTCRVEGESFWRTALTPVGPGTVRLRQRGLAVHADAWGEGAQWLLDGVPDLCGASDDPDAFESHHVLVAESARRVPGLRLPRCRLVTEMAVGAVLEQKVTGVEARRAWRWLVLRHGTAAPGPAPRGMRVAPTPGRWKRIPSWDWHRAGVDPKRSRTAIAVASVASALERTVELSGTEAGKVLQQVPGVGPWTAAEVVQRAHGCPDSVSVGDYHLAAFVGWALLGHPLDDEGMLAELACYAGQRQRAVRFLECSGARKPRFGPRMTIEDHRFR
jgi:3-methyladenine DNA glycosylase/8-oxoguanine DNA glycosylase